MKVTIKLFYLKVWIAPSSTRLTTIILNIINNTDTKTSPIISSSSHINPTETVRSSILLALAEVSNQSKLMLTLDTIEALLFSKAMEAIW